MIEPLEDEVSETAAFELTQPPRRVDPSELPQSPKSTFKAAVACNWEVRAWLTIGEVAPTLYLTSSKEGDKNQHLAGEVRYDGYVARLFTVEARDLSMPLGFQAHYLGKQYEDGRKGSLGSFSYAMVADPVGVPRALGAEYRPIKQIRGKFETASSFLRRQNHAKGVADEMAAAYNDGAVSFQSAPMFTVAGEFDAWLAEWRSFATPIKKAPLHA